ncbi:hypothetical protein N7E02_25735 [Aliirhizobium terrae]|uniref:hypothetical protein n=1 Tax=Terrirhizobium terrae TaxID=2926709 RepID=UPI0025790D5A|nr:hypothetical protein [Rhizobium sp. CC-CFT758]WJH40024.1 hypothetical protein N7E02_25735 [Rhizobium sp. CC-CFT758]
MISVAERRRVVRVRSWYAYLGALDWALRHLSPGKVQMEMTVCRPIESGEEAYDLLGDRRRRQAILKQLGGAVLRI